MQARKTDKADLESKKFIYKEIGLIVALAFVLLTFELKSYDKQELIISSGSNNNSFEEMAEITQQKKPPPTPPPKQVSIINIVDNEIDVLDDIEIDAEANQETEMEEYIPNEIMDLEEEEVVEEDPIFVIVETMPCFPGGDAAFIKYLNKNVHYPSLARESGIQGKVFVTFVVETDGAITNITVLRGIGGGCDEEAVKVVQNMPKWIPGKQRNAPVRVQFNLPIKFTLR